MRKEIIEFREMEGEKDLFEIELGAYELTTKENEELREELEKLFDIVGYTFIDSDSFQCVIKDVDYDDLKKLEKSSWSF